jgi:hypothetical protein
MKQIYIEVDENLQQKIRQQYIQTPGLAFYLGIIHGTPTNLHLDMITIDARFVIRRGYSLDFLIYEEVEYTCPREKGEELIAELIYSDQTRKIAGERCAQSLGSTVTLYVLHEDHIDELLISDCADCKTRSLDMVFAQG